MCLQCLRVSECMCEPGRYDSLGCVSLLCSLLGKLMGFPTEDVWNDPGKWFVCVCVREKKRGRVCRVCVTIMLEQVRQEASLIENPGEVVSRCGSHFTSQLLQNPFHCCCVTHFNVCQSSKLSFFWSNIPHLPVGRWEGRVQCTAT